MGMRRVECQLEKDGGGDRDEKEHGEDEDGNKIHEEEDEKTSPLNFEVIVVHDLCDHVRMHNHP